MSHAAVNHSASSTSSRGGKYLTFALGNEEFGLPILAVREIIKFMDVTAVPKTPAFVRGVINLRGQVISVVDLRAKFDMPQAERTDETCIIVVETRGRSGARAVSMGVVVDRVREVQNIAEDAIEDPPTFGTSAVDNDFIRGMGKVGQAVKILLDIDRVLSDSEVESLAA